MEDFGEPFEERLSEIEAYLELLDTFDQQTRHGLPRVGLRSQMDRAARQLVISPQQQRILYSSVFLQLYNLVESTVTSCIGALSAAIIERQVRPGELTSEFLREWVRFKARTHTEMNYENRLTSAMSLCDHLVQTLPMSKFEITKGGGGNWDDAAIEKVTERLGLRLPRGTEAYCSVKRHFRNEQGALVFIKSLRNDLAHGSVSFVECSEGVSARDLRDLKSRVVGYLREVVSCFRQFIEGRGFLKSRAVPA